MKREQPDIPPGMRKIVGRFNRWRNKHPGVRLPIPKALWILAAEVARENGVGRTVQILGLEYGKLKRLAESGVVAAKRAATPATFCSIPLSSRSCCHRQHVPSLKNTDFS